MIRRRLSATLLVLFATLAVSHAFAHSKLIASVPAEAAVLNAAPPMLQLTFNEPLRLTALTLESADGSSRAIENLPAEQQTQFELTPPVLAAGPYTLTWRGIGKDGHVVSGTVKFTLAP